MSEAATQEMPEPILHEDSQAYTQVFKNDIEKQLQEIIDEIVILQSYARSVSKIIPENILSDLSKLIDNCLNEKTLGESLKLALSVHGGLSQVVAPVTVRSLRATDPNQGLINWIKQVWAIPVIFSFTLLAFGFYIYHIDLNKGKLPAPIENSENK